MPRTFPDSYYTADDLQAIASAMTFEMVADVVCRVLARMPRGVTALCGPVSTGGAGSRELNLIRFGRAIQLLAERGENIYSQIPFEKAVKRIVANTSYYRGSDHLLETLYLPIFTSGYISCQCFLPDWLTSHGTRWEKRLGEALGLSQKFLRDDFETLPPDVSLFTA